MSPPIARVERDIAPVGASRAAGFALELTLTNAAPGTYALNVSAGPSASTKPQLQEIPIVVR